MVILVFTKFSVTMVTNHFLFLSASCSCSFILLILTEKTKTVYLLGEAHWNCPPWPGTIVTICMSCFTTGGPGKEHGTNKPPPTGRVQERSKWDTTCLTTSQNSPIWHPSLLNKVCTTRKDSESEWLAKDNLETNPITIKPKIQATWQSSSPGFPYPPACLIKSLALSAYVSPRKFISEC